MDYNKIFGDLSSGARELLVEYIYDNELELDEIYGEYLEVTDLYDFKFEAFIYDILG